MRFLIYLLLAHLPITGSGISHASEQQNWIVTQQATDFSYDTGTQMGKRKDVERKGLISVSTSGNNQLISYWSPGAYRATITYNGKTIVDGYDLDDVSRISSFRFNKFGSTAYIRTTKGPTAIVELFLDNQSVANWPRLSIVKILSYKNSTLTISLFREKSQTTEFWRYTADENNPRQLRREKIGSLKGCSLLGSKVTSTGIALEVYCSRKRGSDIKFLTFKTGEISTIAASENDEILAYSLAPHDKGSIPVLVVSGNTNARQFFHAFSGALLKNLGEPMAYASDEGGKQSWSQSYRTRVLATLFQKTDRELFAVLSIQAMKNTLDQQNENLGIRDRFNPSCGWASRIYSTDKKSPISFMINQAMISASLIESCKQLGNKCDKNLHHRILANASCLVRENEQWFVADEGLYRIPYDAPFRYDGIWAPWNWHMMWTVVLDYVGKNYNDNSLKQRAASLTTAFINSWETTTSPTRETEAAAWRYWTRPYYDGWHEQDKMSVSRIKQNKKNMNEERYEDLNHAGISLLGLSGTNFGLSLQTAQTVSNRIDLLLEKDTFLPRDMDGNGSKSPRWRLGAGWHLFATERLHNLYAHKLPGSVANDQHLAYALLFDNTGRFDLELRLKQCNGRTCSDIMNWSYKNFPDFLDRNPLAIIQPK
ncbi:MAG: hypothetical protein JKY12_04000 [Sneathiella sp.]|nr:hypothetical protein [Sneathiella sp.]